MEKTTRIILFLLVFIFYLGISFGNDEGTDQNHNSEKRSNAAVERNKVEEGIDHMDKEDNRLYLAESKFIRKKRESKSSDLKRGSVKNDSVNPKREVALEGRIRRQWKIKKNKSVETTTTSTTTSSTTPINLVKLEVDDEDGDKKREKRQEDKDDEAGDTGETLPLHLNFMDRFGAFPDVMDDKDEEKVANAALAHHEKEVEEAQKPKREPEVKPKPAMDAERNEQKKPEAKPKPVKKMEQNELKKPEVKPRPTIKMERNEQKKSEAKPKPVADSQIVSVKDNRKESKAAPVAKLEEREHDYKAGSVVHDKIHKIATPTNVQSNNKKNLQGRKDSKIVPVMEVDEWKQEVNQIDFDYERDEENLKPNAPPEVKHGGFDDLTNRKSEKGKGLSRQQQQKPQPQMDSVDGNTRKENLPESHFRQAPFCVDVDNTDPEEIGLLRFASIFGFHRFNSYVPVATGKMSPAGLVDFHIFPISVDDAGSTYKSVLHNWVHIVIESKIELEGLYVQANSAPWGIPFGEFVTNFDCGDCKTRTSRYLQYISLVPCMARAALSYDHPNVLTVGGAWAKGAKFKEIHFNFKYIQYPGVDHTYAQFLVIAVRKFHREAPLFETFFTQIYKLSIDKNPAGAYAPFYYGWKSEYIKCHHSGTHEDIKPWESSSPKIKLRYSRNFDSCVKNKVGLKWLTCPPGPLQAKEGEKVPVNLLEWNNLRSEYQKGTSPPPEQHDLGVVESNKQFCADTGTWEWTVGQKSWEVPPEFAYDETSEEETISVEETGKEDEIPEETNENCEEFEGNLICRYTNTKSDPKAPCDNYHASLCPVPKRPIYFTKGNSFTNDFDAVARKWGQKYILKAHGILMVFAWTTAFNILAYVARYQKEDSGIEENSRYFGIGQWLWNHINFTYLMLGSMITGFVLTAVQKKSYQIITGKGSDFPPTSSLHDLCNVQQTLTEVRLCVNHSNIHRYFGIVSVFLLMMSYASGWGRPESTAARRIIITYHIATGYIAKIVAVLSTLVYLRMTKFGYIPWLLIINAEVCSIVMFGVGAMVIKQGDAGLIADRQWFPVIEGISPGDIPPSQRNTRRLVFWIHFVLQMGSFIFFAVYYDPQKASKSHRI